MKILSIDTSSKICSVSVLEDTDLIIEKHIENELTHSQKLMPLIDEVLNISTEGKVSSNLVEKVIETVPITDSYRKAETVIEETTNTSLSHEKIRNIIIMTK